MSDKTDADDACKVLFVCTGNSARSILAEAILNRIGSPRFQAYSAGTHPKGNVHPEALRLLNTLGHDTSSLRSKSWDEFSDGPSFDHIVTVCNKASGEVCPIVSKESAKMHWDIADPTSVRGSQLQLEAAFRQAYDLLLAKITAFSNERAKP